MARQRLSSFLLELLLRLSVLHWSPVRTCLPKKVGDEAWPISARTQFGVCLSCSVGDCRRFIAEYRPWPVSQRCPGDDRIALRGFSRGPCLFRMWVCNFCRCSARSTSLFLSRHRVLWPIVTCVIRKLWCCTRGGHSTGVRCRPLATRRGLCVNSSTRGDHVRPMGQRDCSGALCECSRVPTEGRFLGRRHGINSSNRRVNGPCNLLAARPSSRKIF